MDKNKTFEDFRLLFYQLDDYDRCILLCNMRRMLNERKYSEAKPDKIKA